MTILNVWMKNIGAKGATALAKALKANATQLPQLGRFKPMQAARAVAPSALMLFIWRYKVVSTALTFNALESVVGAHRKVEAYPTERILR